MKQKSPFPYTTESALAARDNGTLEEWVQEFLLSEENHGLATALRENKADIIDLAELPLDLLKRIEGPEEVVAERESLNVWEERVSRLENIIKEGHYPPPLVITDFWKPLEIADGNHRHEALLRNGVEKYWTIFFIRNESSKDLLKQHVSSAIL